MDKRFDDLCERLFDAPCWVVDIFPRQVPAERDRAYFAVERLLTKEEPLTALYRRFSRLVLKLSCYYDLVLGVLPEMVWNEDPDPETLCRQIEACAAPPQTGGVRVLLPDEDAMLTLDAGDLWLTLYHPGAELKRTVGALAASEGLFLREGQS